MALLEKGLPKDYFRGSMNYLPLVLTLGIVSISIALGTLVGGLLHNMDITSLGPTVYPVSIFLFLGIGLLVSYVVLKKIRNKREKKKKQ